MKKSCLGMKGCLKVEDSLRVTCSFPSEESQKSEEMLVRTKLASFCGTDFVGYGINGVPGPLKYRFWSRPQILVTCRQDDRE